MTMPRSIDTSSTSGTWCRHRCPTAPGPAATTRSVASCVVNASRVRLAPVSRVVRRAATPEGNVDEGSSSTDTDADADTGTDTNESGELTAFANKDAFQALANLGGNSPPAGAGAGGGGGFGSTAVKASAASNPFAASNVATAAAVPAGFIATGVAAADLPAKSDADRLLLRFDRDQRKGVIPEEGTPEGSPQCTHPPLRASCRSLAALSSRVMIGICAPDAAGGVAALKAWTGDLGLPRGMLHGLDVDGKAVEPPAGPVFIKYNSDSGDAFLSGYGGDYRGVLFTPEVGDGAFRQYGYLPLELPNAGMGEVLTATDGEATA